VFDINLFEHKLGGSSLKNNNKKSNDLLVLEKINKVWVLKEKDNPEGIDDIESVDYFLELNREFFKISYYKEINYLIVSRLSGKKADISLLKISEFSGLIDVLIEKFLSTNPQENYMARKFSFRFNPTSARCWNYFKPENQATWDIENGSDPKIEKFSLRINGLNYLVELNNSERVIVVTEFFSKVVTEPHIKLSSFPGLVAELADVANL